MPEISLRLSEIEKEIGEDNIRTQISNVRQHLGPDSKLCSTVNTQGCWSLIQKCRPKFTSPVPVGKYDNEGNLITDQVGLKKLYLETFIWRLRERPMRNDLVELNSVKKQLFESILRLCKKTKSQPCTDTDLEKVLSKLKSKKCRDPQGLINELFTTDVAGENLKSAILMLCNRIKETQQIPMFLQIVDVSALYKGKGSKNQLKNERGIFIVSIYRSILMRLLYNEKYKTIDSHMSPAQVGGRKNMNIRNHIWILNAIIQDVLKSKNAESIDVQILDIKQCFDALWIEECLSDLFQSGLKDDTLNLLYEASKNVQIAVRTPVGKTERKTIESNIVMQGDVWGPLICSNQVDKINKECTEKEKYLYKYKGKVEIPPLAMVDDLICISNCGSETVKLNAYINYKITSKRLQCGIDKCKKNAYRKHKRRKHMYRSLCRWMG